jgi:HlyD family secretion protein
VTKPEVRNISYTIGQPGFVEAYEQTAIYAKVSGFIEEFSTDIGQYVKKGEVLCELFVPELQEEDQQKKAQVKLDQKAVEQAKQMVVVSESNVRRAAAELDEANSELGKVQAEVVRWESELSRFTQMVVDKVVDKQTLDETRKQLQSYKAAFGASQAAIEAKAAARVTSEANLAKAKIDVEAASAKVEVSEADERRVAALLAYTKVTSPYDSVVTVRNANMGDYVQAASGDKSGAGSQSPIFVVARTDLVRIYVDVPETYARFVDVGTKAIVRAEALNGQEISTTVTRTSWSFHEKTRTLRVEIDLPVADCEDIRPGMYVYARVIIERPKVWALPKQTLVMLGNRTYCYLLENNKAVRTRIQKGITDGTWTEVLKKQVDDPWVDLSGEEQFILGDLAELTDGQAVQVAPANSE